MHAISGYDEGLWAKCQSFIKITNIFAEYTKENNRGNAHLDYTIILINKVHVPVISQGQIQENAMGGANFVN